IAAPSTAGGTSALRWSMAVASVPGLKICNVTGPSDFSTGPSPWIECRILALSSTHVTGKLAQNGSFATPPGGPCPQIPHNAQASDNRYRQEPPGTAVAGRELADQRGPDLPIDIWPTTISSSDVFLGSSVGRASG